MVIFQIAEGQPVQSYIYPDSSNQSSPWLTLAAITTKQSLLDQIVMVCYL